MKRTLPSPHPGSDFVDITRFGTGFWIGAGCTSFAALCCIPPFLPGVLHDRLYIPYPLQWSIAASGFLLGATLSAIHLVQGRRSRDGDAVLGGAMGLMLCLWPAAGFLTVLVVAATWPY